MSKGMFKAAAAAGFLVLAGSVLLLLTQRAQAAGRLTYCRNNLRQLGILAHSTFAANYDQLPPTRGRAFWQSIREFKYRDARNKRWNAPSLNPFCCPVRAGAVTDPVSFCSIPRAASDPKGGHGLELDQKKLDAFMADLGTIDFRGPSGFPDAPSKMILGADLEGNHPGGGGHVLLADFTILSKDAVSIETDWSKSSATKD